MTWVNNPPEPLDDLRREEKALYVSKRVKSKLIDENVDQNKKEKNRGNINDFEVVLYVKII